MQTQTQISALKKITHAGNQVLVVSWSQESERQAASRDTEHSGPCKSRMRSKEQHACKCKLLNALNRA